MRLTDEGRARQATGQPAPVAEPTRALDPREAAFTVHRLAAASVYPVDFFIGSLRTTGLSEIERAARDRVVAYLGRRVRQEDTSSFLISDATRGVLAEVTALSADLADAASIRVGRPKQLPANELSVRFRTLGATSDTVGEVILELVEGQWYIADIQVTAVSGDDVGSFAPGDQYRGAYW